MSSSRMVHDLILVISLLSITCFVPSRNTDPTIHVEENPATWKIALEDCVGRGERLVSPQNLPDKHKDRLLPKLEKDVKFWTMPMNISQVVVWSGCVQEASQKALSLLDIHMSYFGMESSLPKCLGYCLNRDKYVAVGLKADGICMCFYNMEALALAEYWDYNFSATRTDECGDKFISLYHLVPTGRLLTTEEELLDTGKCVYIGQGADKHFHVSSCDNTMPGFLCQTHNGSYHDYIKPVTWQQANRACREMHMMLSSSWDKQLYMSITGSYLWMGFFVSPTPITSPDYNAEGNNCPIIWKTDEGNLQLGKDNCHHSHRYLCIQDKKSISHTGSTDLAGQIIGAVVGSFVAVILIAAVVTVIYRRRAKGRGLNKMIFDNRMYQEVMETGHLGCHSAVRNQSNQVTNIPWEGKCTSDIYAEYAEINVSHVLEEACPEPAAGNCTISQGVHSDCLHYASSSLTQLTGNTNISTIPEQCGVIQTFGEDVTKPVADPEKQTEKQYETIF